MATFYQCAIGENTMVRFFVRKEYTNGLLAERMRSEGLPQSLDLTHSNNGRKERRLFECSSELALAMLRDGADLEFTQWSPETLEYRKLNMP